MRIQGCGWQHTSKRTAPDASVVVGYSRLTPTVCPGYSTQLPGVEETIRAYGWAERGQVEVYTAPYRPTPKLVALVDVLASSVQRVEAQEIADAREESKRRRDAAAF